MPRSEGGTSYPVTPMHRVHARLSTLARPATGFVSQPEPRTIGTYAKGRQLIAGNFLFAGFLIEAPGLSIWDAAVPDPRFAADLHGFRWLDDLAAVGDGAARTRAQAWTLDWITRFGTGGGPGWTPDLAGRRIIRWINHAIFLLNGVEGGKARLFFRSLGRQTAFLARRWQAARPGLPRFEALTGLIYAGLSLTGMERHVDPAVAALARDCQQMIDAEGGIATRNPEDLLEVFTLLTWASAALSEAGRTPSRDHLAAIARIAPTLRALRHADGGLARFHGGGRGAEGRLDQALSSAGGKPVRQPGLAMGYARLSAGRTSVIVDAAPPPAGRAGGEAHASTLAFELTSGRRPLIVNCGSGAEFGPEWQRAGRATPLHSTLGIRGLSSSRFGTDGRSGRAESLIEMPDQVWSQSDADMDGLRLLVGHNGYAKTHGLTHVRQLEMSVDGRGVSGEDTLGAMTGADRRRFEAALDDSRMEGLRFDIRFHLHPDVDAAIDMGGAAVSLALKSSEIWVFRHDGVGEMTLEPSVYLQKGRLKPRPSRQIVLSAVVMDYACQICWTLAKAQDTPAAIRDTGREEEFPEPEKAGARDG
jgi:uncharacterized heparinase superfamily protein